VLRPARLPKNSAGPKQISSDATTMTQSSGVSRMDDAGVYAILHRTKMFSHHTRPVWRNCQASAHSTPGISPSRFGLRCGSMLDPEAPAGNRIRRSYIRVIVVWVVTLAALYAFQEYFS
jgi:hypothetical protein